MGVVPTGSERHCTTCDTAKVRIGADITEELDYVPASFVIREYVRPRYACGRCQQGVVQADLPARPIEKGRPGPGLLAHVVSSKYADHLPLYRLEQIFERHGVQIARRTLSEWNGTVADLLEPIVRAMHREQVAPVAVDSMRRHNPGCTGPESSAGDSDRASVSLSG
jgi:transposase